MNALPTGPHKMVDAGALNRYFVDMARCGYDVAYNSCNALPYNEIVGSLAEPYRRFAETAKKNGYPACIQMQPTICRDKHIDISEAQYHLDNGANRYGDDGFYASYASTRWLDHVKDLVRVFIQDYGYDWIVFEKPIYSVDIPGAADKFHKVFAERYPGVEYPQLRSESASYLKVQKLKYELCLEFYSELTRHAKAVGAKKVGVIPCQFIPTVRDTPKGTFNPSSDIGTLVSLTSVDFVVSQLQPAGISEGSFRTGDDMEKSPLLCYTEILSQSVGKPVVAIHSCMDDGVPQSAAKPITNDFFKESVLSTVAAAPSGITIQLYGNNCENPSEHREMLCEINKLLPRFRHQRTPVGLIYSPSSARHAEPFTHEAVWKYLWHILKHMEFTEKWPVITLSADAISEHLAANPQLRLLLLEEHFPLTEQQVKVILNWWTAEAGRALVVVSGGQGLSADPDRPGLQPASEAFPGLMEHIGLITEIPSCTGFEEPKELVLKQAGPEYGLRSFEDMKVKISSIANIRRIFGSHASVLFENTDGKPVITKYVYKGALAYFCAIGSSTETAPIITHLVRTALKAIKRQLPCVSEATGDVLWNVTADGYVVIANCSKEPGRAKLCKEPFAYWDVLNQELVKENSIDIELEPHSIRVLRWLPKTSKLYDITGVTQLKSLAAGAGRADIVVVADQTTEYIVRSTPREILVDGRPVAIVSENCGQFDKVRHEGVHRGEHTITLRW